MSPDADHAPRPPAPQASLERFAAQTSVTQHRSYFLALAGLMVVVLATLGCALALLLPLLKPDPVYPVTIVLGDTAFQAETRAATVQEALDEQGITLGEADVVSPPPDNSISAGMTIQIARARHITLIIDGQSQTLRTLYLNPFDILNEAGVTLEEPDRIWVDGAEASALDLLVWPVPATQITVRRAATIYVDDDGQISSFKTTRDTVGEALFEAGVTLYLADEVTPDLNAPITAEMRLRIRRSSPISIVADGVTLETRAQGSTVADAVASAGVALMGLDYAIPDEDSPLQPGMFIRVIRVTEQVIVEQEAIPFETIYQADGAMELDQQIVVREGQNGIRQINLRARYENRIEVRRTPESEQVAVEPLNRVVAYGTQIVLRTVETPVGPREYWRRLRLYATSYHPAALGGDNVTATGRILTKGIVGIDPTVIPYGTELFVPGYGVGVAADTGGPRRTRLWIDLGYDDANWVSWSKPVDVYLLTPVPSEIDYLLPG